MHAAIALTLTALSSIVPADLGSPCGSALFGTPPPPPPPRVRPLGGVLGERDAYGLSGALANDRFVVRWGPDAGDLTTEAAGLLAELDRAWQVQVVELGYPLPATTDEWKFNVYVGDTGGGAPEGLGTAGYFWFDPEDFPILVIALSDFKEQPSREWTAAHEYHHAVQWAIGSYLYEGEGAWFFEASAEWATTMVLPESSYNGSMLGPYAMLSYLGVPFFDYPDEGLLTEYHQYGAFIFPRFVSEKLLGPDVVRLAWTEPDADNEPMLALARQLENAGISLADALADFGAANVTWDYEASESYSFWATSWIDLYPGQDFTLVGELPIIEDDVPVAAPAETLPERFGLNMMAREIPASGTWRVIVDADGIAARLVVEGVAVQVLPVAETLEVELEEGDRVTLVIAAVDPDQHPRARTPWSAGLRLLESPGEGEGEGEGEGDRDDLDRDDEPAPALGCGGCAASDAPALAPALAGLALVRRRRRGG